MGQSVTVKAKCPPLLHSSHEIETHSLLHTVGSQVKSSYLPKLNHTSQNGNDSDPFYERVYSEHAFIQIEANLGFQLVDLKPNASQTIVKQL